MSEANEYIQRGAEWLRKQSFPVTNMPPTEFARQALAASGALARIEELEKENRGMWKARKRGEELSRLRDELADELIVQGKRVSELEQELARFPTGYKQGHWVHHDEVVALEKRIEAMERWTPEQLALLFHDTYERLAPSHGWQTQERSRKPWEEVPSENKSLMIAVASEVLAALSQAQQSDE